MINLFLVVASIFFIGDAQIDTNNSYTDSIATIVSETIGSGTHVYDCGDVAENGYPVEYDIYDTIFPNSTPIPGNHDYYNIGYWPYGYTVDIVDEGVHIVGWNTSEGDVNVLAEILDDDMPTILYMHHPIFSDNDRNGAFSDRIKRVYEPIVKAADVDLVICGHGHAYERHGYNKITYLVIGGAGAPLDSVGVSNTQIISNSIHHFVEIQFANEWLNVLVRDLDGFIIDIFDIYTGDDSLGLPGPVGSGYSVQTEQKSWAEVKGIYLE